MEEKGAGLIAAFDSLYTTNRIQMLKVLLTRLPTPSQGGFAIYIKFLELQYAISLLRQHPTTRFADARPLSADLFSDDTADTVPRWYEGEKISYMVGDASNANV